MEKRLNEILTRQFGKTLGTADDAQIYAALAALVREELEKRPRIEGSKKLYYVSAEFLMGKLLSNNLIALGLFDEAKTVLARYGVALSRIEEQEREPSLGNGLTPLQRSGCAETARACATTTACSIRHS